MSYIFEREMQRRDGYKMGLDYLPLNYDKLDQHKKNNQYMVALWNNENDLTHEIIAFCEFENGLEDKLKGAKDDWEENNKWNSKRKCSLC